MNSIHFPRGGVSRAAAIAALATLLAASPVALARQGVHATAKPQKGGTISLRLTANPECLDPTQQSLAVDSITNSSVMDGLVALDHKGHLVPNLATKWKISNGGKTITFTLRKGVKFSNGDPFTANDVKFTYDRALNPAVKSPISRNFLGPLDKTVVVNKYTVRLQLKTPLRVLMSNLSSSYLGILDPKAINAEGPNTCQGTIGTGPFKIASVAPGFASVKQTRNKNHTWEPKWLNNKGPAYLNGITYQSVVSDATAVSELLSGDLDITDVPGTELSRVQNNKHIVLHKFAVQGEDFLEFNQGRAPFDNAAARKAVAQVINRSDIIKAALNGLGKPSYSILPPSIPMYDPKSKKYVTQLDLSAATKTISDNHLTGPYDFLISNSPASVAAAQVIQAELGQAGMKVNIVTKPTADWLAALKAGKYDMSIVGYTYNDPDVLYLLFHSSQKQGLNFTNATDPTLDQLVLSGRETLNQKKAIKDYANAQKRLDSTNIAVPLWAPLGIYGARDRVQGWHATLSGFPALADLWVK